MHNPNDITRRLTLSALCLLALLLVGGTQATAEVKRELIQPQPITILPINPMAPGPRYGGGGGNPKGGGHGGSGATMVPIVDDDILFMVQWTRDHLNADDAHTQATGDGVTVAVLDGGFNLSHPDLAGHISTFAYDAIDDDWDPEDLGNGIDDDGDGWIDDGLGHGTFVASMVLLAAPDATIMPIRVRDDEGWGFNHELMRGLTMAWKAGADIVNISGWMDYDPSGDVLAMVRRMRDAGITVIVSAGNDAQPGLGPLAASSDTLAVGATDTDDVIAWFSNHDFGTSPGMVMAPGVNLYGAYGFPEDDSSAYWSGTSFSAGLVSGAAALAVEQTPHIAPGVLFQLLWLATDPAYDDFGQELPSTGRINLWKVVTQ